MIPNCEINTLISTKDLKVISNSPPLPDPQILQFNTDESLQIDLTEKHRLECPQNNTRILLPRKMKFRQFFGLTSRSSTQTNMDEISRTSSEDRAGKKNSLYVYLLEILHLSTTNSV